MFYEMNIVEVKDDDVNVIVKANIPKNSVSDFRPYFKVKDEAICFMLSDFEEKDTHIDVYQRFYKYKDGKTDILYETMNECYLDEEEKNTTNNQLISNLIWAHPDGQILFQDFKEASSRLLLYKDDEITTYEIGSANDFLRGFIDKYAVLFSRDEQKHYLLDIETSEKIDLDYTTPMYITQCIKNTMMYVRSNMSYDMILLQENGEVMKKSFSEFFDSIDSKVEKDTYIFLYSDGEDIFIDLTDAGNDKPVHNFYTIDY